MRKPETFLCLDAFINIRGYKPLLYIPPSALPSSPSTAPPSSSLGTFSMTLSHL